VLGSPRARYVLAFTTGALLAFGAAVSAAPHADPAQPRGAASHVAMSLPPLPDSIITMNGWVHVTRPAQPYYCGLVLAWGCYDYVSRRLDVVTGLSRWAEWQVLEHEKVHVILGDARLRARERGDSAAVDDQIAEAVSNFRMLERLAPDAH
jgi:hypothetical protein